MIQMKRKGQILPSAVTNLAMQGHAIRRRRTALKISATVAAEAAAISRLTWCRIEKGDPGVSGGAYASALAVLGLTIDVHTALEQPVHTIAEDLPEFIRVAEYPQLRQLAWHVRENARLTAQEAFGIYERNRRHYNPQQLSEKEQNLERALWKKFTGHDS